jgi:hypothetical protein
MSSLVVSARRFRRATGTRRGRRRAGMTVVADLI